MNPKATAFLRQARADFEAFRAASVLNEGLRDCHRLMLLQMACEKLAKAALYQDDPTVELGHGAFTKSAARLVTRRVSRIARFRSTRNLAAFVRDARGVFLAIESLSPAVGAAGEPLSRDRSDRAENVEYPWLARDADGSEVWHVPADYSFGLARTLRRDRTAAGVVTFIEDLLTAGDAIFD